MMYLIKEKEKNGITYKVLWDGRQYVISFVYRYRNTFEKRTIYCFKRKSLNIVIASMFKKIYKGVKR